MLKCNSCVSSSPVIKILSLGFIIFTVKCLIMLRMSCMMLRHAKPVATAWSNSPFSIHIHDRRHLNRDGLLLLSSSTSSSIEESRNHGILSHQTLDKDELERVYNELKDMSALIRDHDSIYYNEGIRNSKQQHRIDPISDDEYDILVKKEAKLCEHFPELLAKLEVETGLGSVTTRYGGRVGPIVFDENSIESEILSKGNEQSFSDDQQLQKIDHLPMLSLDNAMNNAQVLQWIERIEKIISPENKDDVIINVTPKLDGLSLTLRYTLIDDFKHPNEPNSSCYEFEWAATRGNGKTGDDVSEAISMIENIPKTILLTADNQVKSPPMFVEVRGEVILPIKTFLEYRHHNLTATDDSTNQQIFSNPRNAASGILRRTKNLNNDTLTLRSALQFYAYDVVSCDESKPFGLTAGDVQQRLLKLGFAIPQPTNQVSMLFSNKNRTKELFDFYEDLVISRQNLPFEIDGVVYKLDSLSLRDVCGSSSRTPRWAIAHKFAAQSAVTHLLDIETQVGRTGALTPVAILEPVNIGGVSVSRATLHNFFYAASILSEKDELSVRRMTQVVVSRAGDVIPQITRRLEVPRNSVDDMSNSKGDYISIRPPSKCPACGFSTFYERKALNNTERGQVLRCGASQLACEPRVRAWLAHAFSRDAINVAGLSEAKIFQLMGEGILREPSDLFRLCGEEGTVLVEKVSDIAGWGPKSSSKLVSATSKVMSRGITLSQFIYSLGIRHCGIVSSQLLALAYCSSKTFLSDLKAAQNGDIDAFSSLDETVGVGPVLIESLRIFAKDDNMVSAAERLSHALSICPPAVTGKEELYSSKPLHGLRVVFSGGLGASMSRSVAQKHALAMGAVSTPSTISKATNLVIAGEGGGKKIEMAKEFGIKIINSAEWFKLVEDHTQN